MRPRAREIAALAVPVAAGLLYRLLYVVDQVGWLNGDNAVVGLMARHILEGRHYVFFWGQPYMGTLEPYSIALVAAFTGLDDVVLRAVPLLYGMAWVLALHGTARALHGPRAGLAALAMASLCPPFLALWSTGPRGGYVESLLLGQLVLWLAVVVARDRPRRWGSASALGLGLLGGLALWTNPLSVSYLATAGIVLLAADPVCWRRPAAAMAAAAAVVGSAPLWVANLLGGYESLSIVAAAPDLAGVGRALRALVVVQAPMLAGAREVFGAHAVVLSPLGIAAALIVAAGLAWGAVRRPRESRVSLVLLAVTVGVWLPSVYSQLATERYLLPAYSAAIPLLAVAWTDLLARSRIAAGVAAAVVAATVAAGAASVHTELRAPRRDPHLPEVLDFMTANGIRHGYADHSEALVNTYRSGERVILLDHRVGRYPVGELPAWEPDAILERGDGGRLAGALDALGCRWRKQRFPYYALFHDIRPRSSPERLLARDGWVLRAGVAGEDAPLAIDGDLATRWPGHGPQRPGMHLEIDLGRPSLVSGVRLDAGEFVHDFPRGLRVEARGEAGAWVAVSELPHTYRGLSLRGGHVHLGPESVVEVRFAPVETSGLRIVQTGTSERFDWSVAELYVFGVAEEADSRARTTRSTAGAS